jgi:ribonuclease PH
MQRQDRQPNKLRQVSFQSGFTKFATSSVLTRCGDTQVLCTVTITNGVPKFLAGTGTGWLTAEYRMLPGATPQRHERELMKLSGRTQEIQRLIGRSLRSTLDFAALGEKTITIDADVLQADAGTRTTAITGGYVALVQAIHRLVERGELSHSPIVRKVAAVSVGLVAGSAFLDLDYSEDVAADVDFNVVMTDNRELIEVQGTAESGSFSRQQLNELLDIADTGIQELMAMQNAEIAATTGNTVWLVSD